MLARNEMIFKWTLYVLAALLCVFCQTAVLQRFTVWGVIPFIYPLLAAIPATFEAPSAASVFSLGIGVLCDALLPGPLPCFYTLSFFLSGLIASLAAQSLLSRGILCSFLASAAAFAVTDLFYCMILWLSGKGTWQTGLTLMVREFVVAAPWVLPLTWLFGAVYNKTHLYD